MRTVTNRASRSASSRRRSRTIAAGIALLAGIGAAHAADCPGHPDALGVSRTIVVDPREHPRIGTMQYPETLPLHDHEVVLTFDDGPLPKYSNKILDILAAECIKATFFEIGAQAQANPEGVRKLIAAGHTVGTHSQNHPLTFQKMPIEKAEQEINDGIASVSAALADPGKVAPFFRIPGLLRAEGVEDYLASRGIQVWSADFPADDWRHIPPARVYQLAMQRIEAKGKGILLLHDIQPRTVAALPKILHDLNVRGFHIVHVVPASADRPATPTEPQEWRLHPTSEHVPIAHWPKVPGFAFAGTATLPAPAVSDLGLPGQQGPLLALSSAHAMRGVPALRQDAVRQETGALALPVPAQDVFEIPERSYIAFKVPAPVLRHAENETGGHAKVVSADPGFAPRTGAAAKAADHVSARGHAASRDKAGVAPGKPVAAAQAKKGSRRPTRIASLKKR